MFSKDQLLPGAFAIPRVIEEYETVRTIIRERASIARYGDGEFHLVRGTKQKCQPFHSDLQLKLAAILHSKDPRLLVGIPRIYDGYVKKNAPEKWEFWGCMIHRWQRFMDLEKQYYSAFVTRPDSVPAIVRADYWDLWKEVWKGRKIVHVVGANCHVDGAAYSGSAYRLAKAPGLFDTAEGSEVLTFKGYDAFSDYDEIIASVKRFSGDWVVCISLGPTATALAADLCTLGYQALDIGHLPMFYRRKLKEIEAEKAEQKRLEQEAKKGDKGPC